MSEQYIQRFSHSDSQQYNYPYNYYMRPNHRVVTVSSNLKWKQQSCSALVFLRCCSCIVVFILHPIFLSKIICNTNQVIVVIFDNDIVVVVAKLCSLLFEHPPSHCCLQVNYNLIILICPALADSCFQGSNHMVSDVFHHFLLLLLVDNLLIQIYSI